ncbi:hypothetical protein A33Q_1664 [Indibacter alkaliphilus LW1]|uniref:Uncharacterized protein n=1 Tax=Indibacter alkaliphilus (strain CCUG 57479 / KCTC 22604 / LW1) TaxID=1189612 RepID=S2DKU5_INDAL|nr:hypothetical protein A33Q_1664 [Indibacter alkaliphilus LW1]
MQNFLLQNQNLQSHHTGIEILLGVLGALFIELPSIAPYRN